MMTSEQVDELLKENARLRQHAGDKNPLCQGCEEWRRFAATLWAMVWLCTCMTVLHKVKVQDHLSDQEFVNWLLFQRATHLRFLLEVFGIAFAPLLLVMARWNWLLWKNNQPCASSRIATACRWVAGLLEKGAA
jgi:hypothetical protein